MASIDSAGPRAPTRTIGYWMAIPLAVLQAINVARAALNPAGFSTYMGAPLAAAGDVSWVMIYGLRTAFIALLVSIFLVRRDLDALKWTALAALIMPLGDAWIASGAGAETAIIARHGATGAYLLLTTIALFMAARSAAK